MPPRKHALLSLIVLLTGALVLGCGSSSGSPQSSGDSGAVTSSEDLKLAPGGKSISRADCLELRDFLARTRHRTVHAHSRPIPLRFTECQLRSNLGLIVVYLDATVPVRKRYLSRIDGIKAGAEDAADRLHPVPALGESSNGESGAYWVPKISTMYAYRKDGWLTLLYSVEDESNSQRRARASALARRTLELTER